MQPPDLPSGDTKVYDMITRAALPHLGERLICWSAPESFDASFQSREWFLTDKSLIVADSPYADDGGFDQYDFGEPWLLMIGHLHELVQVTVAESHNPLKPGIGVHHERAAFSPHDPMVPLLHRLSRPAGSETRIYTMLGDAGGDPLTLQHHATHMLLLHRELCAAGLVEEDEHLIADATEVRAKKDNSYAAPTGNRWAFTNRAVLIFSPLGGGHTPQANRYPLEDRSWTVTAKRREQNDQWVIALYGADGSRYAGVVQQPDSWFVGGLGMLHRERPHMR